MKVTARVQRALDELGEDRTARAKIGIGMVVAALPVVNIAALGYQVEVARRAARGPANELPSWREPAGLFRVGLGLAVARWIYELPGVALLLAVAGLLFGPLVLALRRGTPPEAVQVPNAAALLAVAALGLWLAYQALLAVVYPAITVQYARHGTLAACFDFGAMRRFVAARRRAYAGTWLSREGIGLAGWLIGIAAGLLVGAAPLIGMPVMWLVSGWLAFVTLLIRGHLIGQLMREEAVEA